MHVKNLLLYLNTICLLKTILVIGNDVFTLYSCIEVKKNCQQNVTELYIFLNSSSFVMHINMESINNFTKQVV